MTLIALAEDSGGVLVDRRFEGRAEVTVEGPAGEAAAASAALAAAVSDVADEVVGN